MGEEKFRRERVTTGGQEERQRRIRLGEKVRRGSVQVCVRVCVWDGVGGSDYLLLR